MGSRIGWELIGCVQIQREEETLAQDPYRYLDDSLGGQDRGQMEECERDRKWRMGK